MRFRVLSLNMFGAPFLSRKITERFTLIADELQKEQPDVICMQEVHLYPHLHLLKVLMPDYPYTAYKRFLYGPKSGLVIFSKLPLQDSTFTGFEERGSLKNKSIVARIIRNGFLKVRIKNTKIIIYNTHLTPNTDIDHSPENRFSKLIASQLFQIGKKAREDMLDGYEVIMTGDFNLPPESLYYQKFVESYGMFDVFQDNHRPTYHKAFRPDDKPGHRLDYIFIPDRSELIKHISSHYILDEPINRNGKELYLSDHIGVLASFDLKPDHILDRDQV